MGSKQGKTRKGGKLGVMLVGNPPKMFGLTEMSTRGGGWAVLRWNKLF